MKKILFKGCGTAISTPFDENGVNLEEFEKLVENQIQKGNFRKNPDCTKTRILLPIRRKNARDSRDYQHQYSKNIWCNAPFRFRSSLPPSVQREHQEREMSKLSPLPLQPQDSSKNTHL